MQKQRRKNQYYPFKSSNQYGLVKAFCMTRTLSKPLIQTIAVDGATLGKFRFTESEAAFASSGKFFSKIDDLRRAGTSWLPSVYKDPETDKDIQYHRRDPLAVLQEIFEDKSFANQFVTAPVKEYNSEKERIYSDLHNTNDWWDMQVLPTFILPSLTLR